MSDLTSTLQRVRFEEVTPANEYAAFFDASIESLVAQLDLSIFEGYDDLDALRFTFLTLPSGETVTLGQYPRAPEPGTYLYVVAITPETPKLVAEVCEQLNVATAEILWVHPDFQDEFKGMYSAHGKFHREHESPQSVESWGSSDCEPIDCFQYALKIYARQQFPEYWAMLQHNLGLAFYNRNQGDRRENLERSIKCFNNSLQVYTQSEFPVKWEINQQDLRASNKELIKFSVKAADLDEKQLGTTKGKFFEASLNFKIARVGMVVVLSIFLISLGLVQSGYISERIHTVILLLNLIPTIWYAKLVNDLSRLESQSDQLKR